jgi:hypothetical protein
MMVKGNPSGVMILAMGSTADADIAVDLGKSRWASTQPLQSEVAMPQRSAPPYTRANSRSDYDKHACYSVDRCSPRTVYVPESFKHR